jgi:Right handed beta helix region
MRTPSPDWGIWLLFRNGDKFNRMPPFKTLFLNRVLAIALIICLLLSQHICALGATYNIAQGGIADHANATTAHSIAWYFKTYGTGNTYVLTSSGTSYNLNKGISVPANCIFQGSNALGTYTLIASNGLAGGNMVTLGSGCTLQYMTIDGNRYPNTVVAMGSTTGVCLSNCVVQNSNNNYTGGGYSICIEANSTTNPIISQCSLLNAGCNPKLNGITNQSGGYGVIMWDSTNALIKDCIISNTLTCGMGLGGSRYVNIISNRLYNTGLNRLVPTNGYTDGPIADGITAYHNWAPWAENFFIYGNTINGTGNHGIHVSGSQINIQNNTILNQQLCAVQVDDWRTPLEYSDNVIIRSNKCGDPLSWVWQPGNSNRKIALNHYNNQLPFDCQTNYDTNGILLTIASANYNIGTDYGPFVFGNTNDVINTDFSLRLHYFEDAGKTGACRSDTA